MSESAGSVTKKQLEQQAAETRKAQPPVWYRSRPMLIVALAVILLALSWTYMLIHDETSMTLNQRVYQVASQLKCPICQGESVANSPSALAQQMRGIIRQQLQEGKSEQQIIQYFEQSYGPSIVWSPPWQGFSLLAWLVPIVLLLGGTVVVFMVMLDWRKAAATAPAVSGAGTLETIEVDEKELAEYRKQVEEELAAEDPLFWRREEKL
jgi:cytochrome c-type biogenesis protein CcmH